MSASTKVAQASAGRSAMIDEAANRPAGRRGRVGAATWLPDGSGYLERRDGRMVVINKRTGAEQPLTGARRAQEAINAIAELRDNLDAHTAIVLNARLRGARFAVLQSANDLFIYDVEAAQVARATRTPQDGKRNPTVSPNGKWVAYTKADNNLYVTEVETKTERAITKDGGPKTLNGVLDWVYEEEVYGRGKSRAFEWSPNSERIAFLRLDETPVKPFLLLNQMPRLQDTEAEQYPKAGDPNPAVTLWTAKVALDDKTAPVAVDLAKYPDAQDRLLVRFGWTPGGKVCYQVQNRTQTWLDVNVADAASGKSATLLRETSPAWVDVIDEPRWLRDGSFVWQSDRTGYRHLYHYRADGTLINAVTQGDWSVQDVAGVDQASGIVYFGATEHSPIATHFYRTALDGTTNTKPFRLTQEEGNHAIQLSPTFDQFKDNWSDHAHPPQTRLANTTDGATIRAGDGQGAAPAPATTNTNIAMNVRMVRVPMRDGLVLDGMLLLPSDYQSGKRYPVYCPVYAGPAAPQLHDDWFSGIGNPQNRALTQRGIIVWVFDNRSATERGAKFTQTSYAHFGEGELRDIEDGLQYLIKEGYADSTRIGISGWSFGGFMVEYALTHSKMFKIGVAGAGVSDWRLYDTIYTERYMKTPQENPDGYRDTSPQTAAANLSGKLLIVHGMMDDNVHLQNTIQFVDALERAGKTFQMVLYPGTGSRHGIRDPGLRRHLNTTMTQFVLDNL